MGAKTDEGRGPVIPSADVSVVVHRCDRPARPVSVQYPGTRGGFMLLLMRSGAFHLSSSHHQLVVDPKVSVRLFSDGFPLARLALVDSRALSSGVVVNTYRPSETS